MSTFKGKVSGGKFWPEHSNKTYDLYVASFEGREVEVTIKKFVKKRTDRQNRALHLWFTQLAQALNKDGFDMKAVIKEGIDIFWSPYTVKEHLWRPVQKAYLGKESTRNLDTGEIDKIFDIINKGVGEKTGVYVPFPSIDALMEEE